MEWQDILKKPSRRQRKTPKYTYKVPKGVYTKPALRAKIHRRLWAKKLMELENINGLVVSLKN